MITKSSKSTGHVLNPWALTKSPTSFPVEISVEVESGDENSARCDESVSADIGRRNFVSNGAQECDVDLPSIGSRRAGGATVELVNRL